MKHVLTPLQPPFPAEIAEILARYPGAETGKVLSLFRVFANSLRFLAGKGVVNLLDEDSPLTLTEREIIILRTTANLDCEYEWGVHVTVFADAAGLSPEQVTATRTGNADAACWSERQSLLIRAVDQLCQTATPDDATLSEMQGTWTREQQLEILALVGNYHTVSFVAKTSRLPGEGFGAQFPA